MLGLGLATLVADNGVTAPSTADHAADPTVLSDVFSRIGGNGVGWTSNTAANGLAVEHYQQYQVRWMNGGSNGWVSHQVAPGVTDHQAWGLGVYCNFSWPLGPRAFEYGYSGAVPRPPGRLPA